MSNILSTPKTAVIFNKRNTLTEVDPHTAVNGIWTVVMEDSTVNIKGCIINNNTNGCIIASNSNATVTNSTLLGQQAGRTTPIVGIKNSKIYWDKPAQLNNTYPYLTTTQDSFANFPHYVTTVGPQALPSDTGALYALLNSGSEIHLQKLKGYPRLLNDGSTFYWDEKDLIYPYDIDSYKLNVLTSTTLTELNHLPKNLHRRDLKIIINSGVTINSTSINGFYNGKVIIEFKSDCTVTSLKISNLDQLEIYNGSISTSETSGSVIEIENVKYVNIHDLTFNINKTAITKSGLNLNFYNYKNNLYEYYKDGMWKACLEIKSSNVVINSCTFEDCYCPIIGSCNTLIAGENNIFTYTNNITINNILFRPVCYISTHNSTINDVTSKCTIRGKTTTLSDMTLNNDQRNKKTSFIPRYCNARLII